MYFQFWRVTDKWVKGKFWKRQWLQRIYTESATEAIELFNKQFNTNFEKDKGLVWTYHK